MSTAASEYTTTASTTISADVLELAGHAPAVLHSIQTAERELADLYHYCERLHQARIQHDPTSCVLCFELR